MHFWLRNAGPAVHLLKIIITIPERTLLDENWFPKIRDILDSESLVEADREYRVLIYKRPRDPRRETDGVLPEVFPRNDQMYLKYLTVEMKKLDHPLLQEHFRWQIFEGDCMEHYVGFKDVESCG
jgi:hypothetical protein